MTGPRRRTLHASLQGFIEVFSAPGDCPAPHGHSAEYQLVLPYAGAFEWHAGAKTVFLDTTRVLFVGADEDYADAHIADLLDRVRFVVVPVVNPDGPAGAPADAALPSKKISNHQQERP